MLFNIKYKKKQKKKYKNGYKYCVGNKIKLKKKKNNRCRLKVNLVLFYNKVPTNV